MPGVLPQEIERLLDAALVCELTVVGASSGRPVSYPLIPLYDGTSVFLTSAVLFSQKLRHLKANPKVAVSLTDPVGVPAEPFARATILGDATVHDTDDPHSAWERVLPLWRAKEPVIDKFLKQRFALPLFFERVVIEITPKRAMYWADGDTTTAARQIVAAEPAQVQP